jgi:alcohol dehydrogenase class IV
VETRLGELGISLSDIDSLVEEMSLERASNNPRVFTQSTAEVILKSIL